MVDSLQAEPTLEERLCNGLVADGLITKSQLEKAKKIEGEDEQNIGEILIEQGLITVDDLKQYLEEKMEIPNVDLSDYAPDPEALEMLPNEVIREYQILPLFEIEGMLTVAIANPVDVFNLDYLGNQYSLEIEPVVTEEKDLAKAIKQVLPGQDEDDALAEKVIETKEEEKKEEKAKFTIERDEEVEEKEEEVEEVEEEEEIAPPEIELERLAIADEEAIALLIGEIIQKAIEVNASHVHIEPMKNEFYLYFRINKKLWKISSAPVNLRKGLMSNVFAMAHLNYEEKSMPQEGVIRSRLGEREIILKVYSFPTMMGNRIVIKIDYQSRIVRALNELGMTEEDEKRFKEILDPSQAGLVLITGPAGSGRTDTFYAAMNFLKEGDFNVFTIENIVQNEIDGINQVALKNYEYDKFPVVIQSILDQDVDVLGFDEITDNESAEQVIHAAQAGILVVATYLGASSIQSINRLIDSGLEPLSLSFSLKGLTAQRLARLNCPNCKKEYKSELLAKYLKKTKDVKLYQGTGCPECLRTGFDGATGIFEVLKINDAIKSLISSKASSEELSDAFPKEKMKSLAENGIGKALKGETTLEEIARLIRIKETS